MDREQELYLWEFSKNLLVRPHRVKVVKECKKIFWIDACCNKRITKTHFSNTKECVGYTKYCLYYFTEEIAKAEYEKMKKEQDERILHSSRNYIEKQAVKEFAERLKQEFFFMKTTASKDAIYQFTDSQLDRFIKDFLNNERH